jgi:subtilisin family serine protease
MTVFPDRSGFARARGRARLRVFGICALAILAGGTVPAAAQAPVQGEAQPVQEERFATFDRSAVVAPRSAFDRLRALARDGGTVRVIVGLRVSFTPEGALPEARLRAQRAGISRATMAVQRALSGTRHRVVHTYETVPYIALEVSAAALTRLEASGLAASLQQDTADPPSLAHSTGIVEAKEASGVARDGRGFVVAILDTGVDRNHPFLQRAAGGRKVISEACFSGNADCPGGVTQSTAAGSGRPCTYAPDGCRHGTHVAGIAAGRGGAGTGASFSGVAPGADILAIQVFSRFDGPAQCGSDPGDEDPCTKSFTSDQIKGLERVFQLRNTLDIAAANMSLGGGQETGTCDTDARKAIIDNLRSVRIATVIASGNDGFSNAVNRPGCISTAVTVGATDDGDVVALFSNSSAVVDLFAPGVEIRSSVPGGGFADFEGTSMATPHVAGAWAVARQVKPSATVAQVQQAFEQSGKPITDTLANPPITRDRIRVFSAAANLRHTGLRVRTALGPWAGLGIVSDGVGLARRTNANPNPTTPPVNAVFNLTGIPVGARVRKAYVVYQTLGGPDPNFRFQGVSRVAKLVGGSGQFTCFSTNNGGAYRTYLYSVPNGVVTGNGAYTIGSVGGGASPVHGRPDGQGASLVVVYDIPGSSVEGRAYLYWGGMTAQPGGPAMNHAFKGLAVPAGAGGRALHVGIGDGEPFNDPAMRFDGTAITGTNFWSGTEGTFWDDARLSIGAPLLPPGVATRTVSQGATAECLTWSYAGLTYRY